MPQSAVSFVGNLWGRPGRRTCGIFVGLPSGLEVHPRAVLAGERMKPDHVLMTHPGGACQRFASGSTSAGRGASSVTFLSQSLYGQIKTRPVD